MRIARTVGVLSVLLGLAGCGGSLNTNRGPDGTTTSPCFQMGACECMAASDRCEGVAEPCWCPSECDPNIACVCGGGKFLECHDRPPPYDCDRQFQRVSSLCSGTPFVKELGGLCVINPDCMGQCMSALTTTESCAQIDCSFCSAACDCTLQSMPSALRTCVEMCWATGNP
jgi:hypothetical protein